jgi:hypothetical protein
MSKWQRDILYKETIIKADYTPPEYVSILKNIISKTDKYDLASILRFNFFEDPYRYTKLGIVRWKCALSLEYLIRNVLHPKGHWSTSHTLMCLEAERTNLPMAILAAESLNILDKVPDVTKLKSSKVEKKRLYLAFRGYFKTSIFTVAHTIQEAIINPNMRKLIISGTMDNAVSIMKQIKSHFMDNAQFRSIFPEMCPQEQRTGKIEFGTESQVVLPNRTIYGVREPTFMAGSTTSKLTGMHFDKMSIDDIIDEKNCTSEEQLKNARQMFRLMLSLFNNPSDPFYDICGTRFHYNDVYGELINDSTDDEGNIVYTTYDPEYEKLIEIKKNLKRAS